MKAAFLLLALLQNADPAPAPAPDSEAAAKAREELGKIRAAIDKLMSLRDRLGRIDQALRQGAEAERMKEIVEERAKGAAEFEKIRASAMEGARALIRSATEGLKKAPDDGGLLEARLETALLLGRNDDALPDLERLSALRPADLPLALRLGRLQHDLNLYEPAAATLERYLKKEAGHRESRTLLALCYFSLHRFEDSLKLLEGILKEEGLEPEQRQQADLFLRMAKGYSGHWKEEQEIRAREARTDDLPRVRLTTSKGEIDIELFENEAPNTVGNFVELVGRKFYDGLSFHRVIPNFMAQGGDPKGDGSGGPGYTFKDELGKGHRLHFRGSLSMANSGPHTNGSQFFITHLPPEWLNGKHTVFGRVIKGLEVADRLRQGDVIVKAEVLRKRDHEYKVAKPD